MIGSSSWITESFLRLKNFHLLMFISFGEKALRDFLYHYFYIYSKLIWFGYITVIIIHGAFPIFQQVSNCDIWVKNLTNRLSENSSKAHYRLSRVFSRYRDKPENAKYRLHVRWIYQNLAGKFSQNLGEWIELMFGVALWT